jgi:hypothetical protein
VTKKSENFRRGPFLEESKDYEKNVFSEAVTPKYNKYNDIKELVQEMEQKKKNLI